MDMEMRRVDAQEARMQQLAGQSYGQDSKNTLTSEDVSGFKGLPAQIANAVRSGMANVKIYIDGYGVGQVVTPYVGSMMAGSLNSFLR
jgi:ribose 5-phosphate isomerase RpiB